MWQTMSRAGPRPLQLTIDSGDVVSWARVGHTREVLHSTPLQALCCVIAHLQSGNVFKACRSCVHADLQSSLRALQADPIFAGLIAVTHLIHNVIVSECAV